MPPAKHGSIQPTVEIVRLLADGRFHSGQMLAARLGLTRSAVCKRIHALKELSLDVYRVPGKGYRLPVPVELLDKNVILSAVTPVRRTRIGRLDIVAVTTSTNAMLLESEFPDEMRLTSVCLAEFQTQGRGRRGRHWVAPFGGGICLSLARRFRDLPPGFTALALVVAIGVTRALTDCGIEDVRLKWPNDLWWSGRKLGGILIEMQGEPASSRIVIGIGLNMRFPNTASHDIDQPWVDAVTAAGRQDLGRNFLAGCIIDRQLEVLQLFEQQGFTPFFEEWQRLDAIAGRGVVLQYQDSLIPGVARGVDEDGALLLDTGGQLRRFISGEVTLRAVT